MILKIRGNHSAYSEKKPYKIKLQKKADLLLRNNDDVYKYDVNVSYEKTDKFRVSFKNKKRRGKI